MELFEKEQKPTLSPSPTAIGASDTWKQPNVVCCDAGGAAQDRRCVTCARRKVCGRKRRAVSDVAAPVGWTAAWYCTFQQKMVVLHYNRNWCHEFRYFDHRTFCWFSAITSAGQLFSSPIGIPKELSTTSCVRSCPET